MTRFDDFGLAGYERGDGYGRDVYRPGGLIAPGALGTLAWTFVLLAVALLLWATAGERVGRLAMWLGLAAIYARKGWRDLRSPLAGDEYATDEERRAVRSNGKWGLASAAIMAIVVVAWFFWGGSHGR